uniref:Uncharacterized protein n=1 Tax=Arundo donax TaxID=35708 RepID=A0A0A8ZDX5_ARUDO
MLWLLQDQPHKYVEDLVNYCHSCSVDSLQEVLCICKTELPATKRQNVDLNN